MGAEIQERGQSALERDCHVPGIFPVVGVLVSNSKGY
jgi:hypothetical protein